MSFIFIGCSKFNWKTSKQSFRDSGALGVKCNCSKYRGEKVSGNPAKRGACTFVTRVTKRHFRASTRSFQLKSSPHAYHICPRLFFSFLQNAHTCDTPLHCVRNCRQFSSQLDRRTGRLLSNTSLCPQTSKSAQSQLALIRRI